MKKRYIKPQLEVFSYCAERGFAWSEVALHKDYILIEGDDRRTVRAGEEVTEVTDGDGEYGYGLWE